MGPVAALAAVLVLAVGAPTARAAAPQLVAPAHGAQHVAGDPPPTFRIAGASPAAMDSLWVHVSSSPTTTGEGVIDHDRAIGRATGGDAAGWTWTPAHYAFPGYWLATPGRYWWQAHWIDCAGGVADCLVESEVRALDVIDATTPPAPGPPPPVPPPPPPVPPAPPADPPDPVDPPVAAPDAGIAPDPIPRHIAARRVPGSFVVALADVPSDVRPARFSAMARTAGGRWGLRTRGVSRSATVTHGDDRTQVGFSWELERDVLGVQVDAFRVRRLAGRRVCRTRVRGGRRVRVCFRRPGRIQRFLSDRDLALNAEVPWQEGPAHPDRGTVDLETVLVHELGHMAGNGHRPRCTNSPMVASLGTGEWWRSPADHYFRGCGMTPPLAVAAGAFGPGRRYRLEHRVLVVDAGDAPRRARRARDAAAVRRAAGRR